jgi:hypothetical protein
MEEYMLNNEDPFQAAAKRPKQVETVQNNENSQENRRGIDTTPIVNS